MVPPLFPKNCAQVHWDSTARTVRALPDGDIRSVSEKHSFFRDQEHKLDAALLLSAAVPWCRLFYWRGFRAQVHWDAPTRTVHVTSRAEVQNVLYSRN